LAEIVVSVIIPTFNRCSVLAETLRHLAAQSVPVAWEVIVVNNRCTDDTDMVVTSLVAGFGCPLTVVHEDRPGAAAARNRGVRSARGDLLVLLDDDIYVGAGQIERAVADHRAQPISWFVAQIVPLPEHGAAPFARFRAAVTDLPPQLDTMAEVETFASGFAVVPRSSLLAVGGYNEDYTVAALEDADLYIRARHHGMRVFYDPKLVGTHNDWAGTTLRDFCLRQRVYCRTAPLLAQRFGHEAHPWSALITANSPPRLGSDGTRDIVRKGFKSLLSHKVPMTAMFRAADYLERTGLTPTGLSPTGLKERVLWSVYRSAIAASMYGGYGEGLAALSRRAQPPQSA